MSPAPKWLRGLEWLVLAVVVAMALASRWELIAAKGMPVPFHDQWIAEGQTILEPWAEGRLEWADFFAPSNEHRPVLTRILAYAELRLTGQWDTRLQMFVNSLFAGLTVLVLGLIARLVFSGAGRLIALVGLGTIAAHGAMYENAVWGFQSQFYLMVLLGVLHIAGTFTSWRIDARWTAAQAAGALGLLAMGGGMLAPLASATVAAIRLTRNRDDHSIATLLSGLTLAAAGWFMLPSDAVAGPLQSSSATILANALVKLLAWPSSFVVLAPLMHLPWLIVALRTAMTRKPSTGDLVLTALGGWVVLQAVAIAFARGGSFSVIPPRYIDILFVGLAVNAACLYSTWRLRSKPGGMWIIALLWQPFMILGFAGFEVRTWTLGDKLLTAMTEANADLHRRTLEAVRDYVRTGDPTALTRDPFVAHHFPSITTMRRLLDNPRIRATLPPEVRGTKSKSASAVLVQFYNSRPKWLDRVPIFFLPAALLVSLILLRREGLDEAKPVQVPWLLIASLTATLAVMLIVAGMRPWPLNPERRFERALDAAGTPVPDFAIPGAAGGIFAMPGTPAGVFSGTYIGGDGYTGELVSSEFNIDRGFLVVPVTGYPTGPGNALRIEFLSGDGEVRATEKFSSGNPGEAVAPWKIAVPDGARARLVLADGSTEPRGWLGVGTPRLTDDPGAARRFAVALKESAANDARRFPAALFVVAIFCAAAGVLEKRSAARGGLASVAAR